jgi:hypothetical protein
MLLQKFLPRPPTDEHKANRVTVSKKMFDR